MHVVFVCSFEHICSCCNTCIIYYTLHLMVWGDSIGKLGYPGGRRLASTPSPKSDITSSSSPDVVIGVLGMAINPVILPCQIFLESLETSNLFEQPQEYRRV